MRLSSSVGALGVICSFQSLVSAAAGALQQITTNFGPNPTNVGFFVYVPAKLQAKPPIMVNPHACHGSAQTVFVGSQFATLADQYGYIVIYPDSPNTVDKCWAREHGTF